MTGKLWQSLWIFVLMGAFDTTGCFWERLRADKRFEPQYNPGLYKNNDTDRIYVFRDTWEDGYCICTFNWHFDEDDYVMTNAVKLMAMYTPEIHRGKRIASRAILTIKSCMDYANEHRGDGEEGFVLLFPVPFKCTWTDKTKWGTVWEGIGFSDDSGWTIGLREDDVPLCWTELRDWYKQCGWHETDARVWNRGISGRSRDIGRHAMIYPSGEYPIL